MSEISEEKKRQLKEILGNEIRTYADDDIKVIISGDISSYVEEVGVDEMNININVDEEKLSQKLYEEIQKNERER